MFYKRKGTIFLLVLGLLVVFLTAYSMAATNTVDETRAGEGAGVISGYEVTNVDYTLDTTDPSKIATVSLTLDYDAGEVWIQLFDTGPYHDCEGGPAVWTCETTAEAAGVAESNQLTVIAAQ